MRALLPALCALALPALPPSAAAERTHPGAGSSSAAFLKVPVGARAVGMGEAFTAASHDARSMWWNPAGLAGLEEPLASFDHQESFQGIGHEFIGAALPAAGWPFSAPAVPAGMGPAGAGRGRPDGTAWGFGFTGLFVPSDIERRSGSAETANNLTASEGGFGAHDLAFGLSHARLLGGGHSLGATAKFVQQAVDGESGSTGAVDLGWRRAGAHPGLSLGAAVLNIGPGVRLGSRRPLPLMVRGGAAWRPERAGRLLLALDATWSRDEYPVLAFGAEMKAARPLAFRAGYRYRWHGNPLGALSGFRTGVGFALGKLAADYAFAPFGELGDAHRFSVGWRFGKIAAGIQAAASPSALGADGAGPHGSGAGNAVPQAAAYRVLFKPRNVSSRGTDYSVEAAAPDGDLPLRRLGFLELAPSHEARPFSLKVSEADPPKPLPEGLQPIRSWRIEAGRRPAGRAYTLDMAAPAGTSVLGLIAGEWRPLDAERTTGPDGAPSLRARATDLPEAVALAVPGR